MPAPRALGGSMNTPPPQVAIADLLPSLVVDASRGCAGDGPEAAC